VEERRVLEVYDFYLGESFNKLGMMVIKGILEELSETLDLSKSKCASIIINKRNVIIEGLKSLKN
jgi:hypothetical protein